MANGGKITFGVGFDVDPSGLNNLKQSFKELKQLTPTDLLKINPSFEGDMKKAKSAWGEIQSTVVRVDHAIDEAFNTDLGVLNINKLNASLERIGVDKIRNSFANAGVAGQRAFNGIAEKALTTNVRLRETETILDSMGKTMMNTIKWGMTSGIWNNFTNGAQQAFGYVKHLDSSLNDIRIVTGKSAEEMDKFAEKANKAAKTLGASTTDYTEASLIYYQQGLSDEETAARAETTIKAANVTGQSGEAVSEQLTAVWNGYKVSAEEAELYIDKLAAVAATTASDLEELSTGMSKVASAAAIMGVDIDQLNAQLATIVSVTREAPESIGTALKTVYARMSDITAGLDGEVSLDEYTQQMEAMGIHVLDANGNLRDMGDVIEEIGGKWQSMSREQQTSLAQTIAGTRQYSRMMSLFDNWDMYTKALETSANAAGTLNKQNEIYLDSAEAHLKQLRTTTEDLYHSLLDADTIKDVADIFTFLIDKVDMFVDAIGGGSGALAGLGIIITKLFSKQIAQGIEPLITNMQGLKQNAEQLKAVMQNVNTFATGEGYTTKATEAMRAAQLEISKYWNVMSAEEINASQEAIREIGRITQMKEEWEAATKAAKEYMMTHTPVGGGRTVDSISGRVINKQAIKEIEGADYSRGWTGIEEDIDAGGSKKAAAERVKTTYEEQNASALKLLETEKQIEQIISKKVSAQSKLSGLLDIENGNIQEQSQLIKGIKNDLEKAKVTGLIDEQEYDYAIQKANELLEKLQEAKVKLAEDSKLSVKDLGLDAKTLQQDFGEVFGAVNQSYQALQEFNQAMLQAGQGSNALSGAQDQLNISILKTRQTITNITKTINTLSNVAMGVNAISGIFDIMNNEDASVIEKITSSFISLSMVMPLLTTISSSYTTVMQALNVAQGTHIIVTGKMIAIEKAQSLALTVGELAAKGNETAIKILNEEVEEGIGDRLASEKAINEETEALLKNSAAAIANRTAKEGQKDGVDLVAQEGIDAEGADKLSTNLNKLKDSKIGGSISKIISKIGSLGKVAKIAGGLILAIPTALQAAYGIRQYFRGQELAEIKEKNNALIEENNTEIETLKNRQEAYDSLLEVKKAYEEGSLTTAEYNQKKVELIASIGAEAAANLDLSQSYEELAKSMAKIKGQEAGEIANKANENAEAAAENLLIDAEKTLSKGHNELKYDESKGTATFENEIANNLAESDLAMANEIDELFGGDGTLTGGDTLKIKFDTNDPQEMARQINELDVILQKYSDIDTNLSRDLNSLITSFKENESYEELNTSLDESTQNAIVEAAEGMDINMSLTKSQEEAEANYTQFLENLQQKQKEGLIDAKANIEDLANTYIAGLGNNFLNEEVLKQTERKQVQNWLFPGGEQEYLEDVEWAEQRKEEINNLIQSLHEQGIDTSLFSEEDWKEIYSLEGEEAQFELAKQTMLEHLDELRNNFKKGQAIDIATQAGTFLEQADYIAPNSLEGNTDWQAFETQLEQVQTLFPELQSDVETLMNPAKQGTEEWIQALERVQGKMGTIAADADGIFTKEEAAAYDLTETTLTEQRNRGDISQEEYQQKFQGAMDYELEELGIDQEEFDAYTEAVEDLTEQYELSDEMVQRIAKDNLKLQKTVDTLASDWEEYGDVLKSGDKTNIKYAQGMGKIRESVEDMFGTDISDDFIQEHLEDIQKLAEGDLTVFDELQKAATEDIIVDIAGEVDASQLTGEFANLNNMIQEFPLENLEMGASLDTTGFDEALNALLMSSEMTIDEANAILESLGFEPEITYQEVPIEDVDFATQRAFTRDEEGNYKEVYSEASLQSGSMVYIPIINGSATKYKGSPKSSITPKSSGGGGGGGGSKPKEPDKKDPIDDEIDRYHDINVEIQRLQTGYDRLQKAQEKLSGADLIKNLNEQLKVLEKQKDAYAAKIELARQEQAELQNSLGAGGVTFAEDGTISNYAAALQNQENQVNAIIANYNNMTAEEQEAYKEVVEKAQEDYEKFKEEIARYDELVNSEIPEMEDAIQEFIDQQVEIQVQKFNMSVEIELDLAEAERQWNEFKKTVIDGIDEDDILGNAGAALNNLNVYSDPTTGEGTVSATSDHVNDILNELALMDAGQESSIYGTDRAKAIEDLKTYSDTLMEEMMNFEGEVEEIRQMYLDLIDETNEEIDKQIENYEFVTSLIEHDLNLIEKIKGEDAYAEMATYYDKQAENYKSQLEFQRQEVNLWKERMDAAKSAGNEDAYEKFKENWMEAVEQLNSTTDAALDNLMSKYENAVNKIFDDLNNKVTNGMGLDYVAEEWELSNQAAERYLDTVNEAFAIDSLRNKYQTAIDESSSLTTQQKLNDLMKEEIEALEKKDKLTQYDVDRANMKYDIALKQLALEEAQQNKSQMRLRRDSQGNYTYQFVSDEDQMAQAQQELAEAQNSLYNFDKERYQANLDEMLSTYTEFTERMAEASLIIDDEERLARQAMLREKYGEIINGIVADNETVKLNLQDSAFTELAGIYDVNTENYKNMTQEQKDLVMSDLIPAWQEGAQAMVDAFSGPGGFEETVSSTFEELDLATQDYVNGLDAIGEAAGVNFDDVINGIDDTIDTMDGIIDGNDDIISQYDEQLDQMDDILDKLDDMIEKYKSIKTEAIAASEAAYKYQKEEAERQAAEAAKKAAEEEAKKQAANSSSKNNGTTTSTTSSSNTTDGGNPNSPGLPSNVSTPKYRVIAAGIGEIWSYDTRGQAESAITANKGKYKGKSLSIAYYKTGGYTGEWAGGSEEKNGKLAMLHQKELVLNEQDTSNVLTAIQILRGMSGVLETMTGRLSSLDGGFSMPVGSMGEIIQEIIINAEFPDATDRTEIQAAFENLVGRASQYAFNTEK